MAPARERQTVVTQDVFVRVLPAEAVDALHEPRCREPDVHVILPPLGQLKAVSDRFIRLASGAGTVGEGRRGVGGGAGPRLVLSATMHGHMRLSLRTDALEIASTWSGLTNPELDPETVEGGEEGVAMHPSTAMRARRVGRLDEEGGDGVGMGDEDEEGEESAWASVIVDGRDWGKVLGVGRLGGRVVACFVHRHALILYVYVAGDEGPGGEESVLTVKFILRMECRVRWGLADSLWCSTTSARTVNDEDSRIMTRVELASTISCVRGMEPRETGFKFALKKPPFGVDERQDPLLDTADARAEGALRGVRVEQLAELVA